MADSPQPSTPTQPALSSSRPASSTSTSTANTTAERAKPASPATKRDSTQDALPSVLTLSDSSSDNDADPDKDNCDTEMRDQHRDDSPSAAKRAKVNSQPGLKRKGNDAPSSAQPAAKKSKAASSSDDKNKGKSADKGADNKGKASAPLVELKGSKFELKQKPLKVNATMSYLRELTAFLAYAVKHLSSSADAKLDDWPEAHHPLISKLVHESPNQLDGVFRTVKRELAQAIAGHMSSLADSQDEGADELDEAQVSARIPTPPLKALIQSLATRTNYGVALNDVEDLPEGVKDVPPGLQIWCWEVRDEEHWPAEMRGKMERRRREREEAKTTALALFNALSASEQAAVLSGSATKSSKAKGKGKAAATAGADSDADAEGDGDGEGGSAGKKAKAKSKGKGKEQEKVKSGKEGDEAEDKPKNEKKKKEKKELTEEEKRDAEEKARVKAEKEAKKAEREREREEKRAKKAEEDAKKLERKAEKDRVKQEKEEEERRKVEAKKKQTNMFTSFFVKPTSSPAPEAAAPSNSPRPTTAKAKESDFDRVFHPFNVRDKVTVAPVNKFRRENGDKVDVQIDSVPSLTLKDSLASFLSTASPRRIPAYNPHPSPPVNVRQCVVAINDSALTSSDTTVYYKLLEDRSQVPVKLFKHYDDVRPGYVGTWTKTSHVVGPRTPFARETALLNYDVDSEDEWAEEDPDAEDVGSDGAQSDDEGGTATGAESEADSWLADDDDIEYEEGYDADGDVAMLAAEGRAVGADAEDDDDVIVVEGEKERRKRERDAKKKKAERERKKKERELRRGPMLPVAKGLCWQDDVDAVEDVLFKPMSIQFLNDASSGLNPFTWVSKPFATSAQPVAASSSSGVAASLKAKGKGKENIALGTDALVASSPAPNLKSNPSAPAVAGEGTVNTLKAKRAPPKQPFPSEHLERFVRHVHGSTKSRTVLVELFVDAMKDEGVSINKNTVDAKYRDLAVKKVKGVLKVADEVLAEVGIAHA